MDARRAIRPQLYLAVYGVIAILLIAAHGLLLQVPYFWDEIGQFIPASLDLFHSGWWIAHSTVPNIHPPGLMAYLAMFWKLFGYSIAGTRVAMLLFAAFGAMATFLLAIELGRGAPGSPAFTALALLGLSPLFFAQSMLAQLDMPAMCLTTLALLLFVQERVRTSAAVCVALVLVKETGIVAPALFGCWLLFERRWRSAWWFTMPVLALAVWLMLLKRATGHWAGNAEFAQYNLVHTLNPVRFGLALLRRFYYLFVSTGHFIGTAACVWAFRRMPALRNRGWRIAAAFVAVHVFTVSLFGGAVLERYLLPALPILYSAFAISLWALRPRMRLATVGALLACLITASFVNPMYPFPLENNLAFVDFVNLEIKAARAVDGMPGTLATSFPMADAFRGNDYGYVWQARKVRSIADFQPESVAELKGNPPELMIVYDPAWDPLHWMAKLPGYRPQMTAGEIGRLLDMRLTRHWERGGLGMELLVRNSGRGGLTAGIPER
jgi:4-amino-4-deoxy-L-arabinose transferase-like glycosyltransferase